MENGQTGAAAEVVDTGDVEAVFGNVEVEVGEVGGGEAEEFLGGATELVLVSGGVDLVEDGGEATEHPFVHGWQIVVRDRVGFVAALRFEIG